MSSDVLVLVATAVLAVVAVGAAVVAVSASRRVSRAQQPATPRPVDVRPTVVATRVEPVVESLDRPEPALPAVLEPRLVEGRVVVPPTEQQVVAAVMSQPRVRLSVVGHGLAHALRAESRDRIVAMMRREYRRRRRERLRAARRAARSTQPPPPSEPGDQWLGEAS